MAWQGERGGGLELGSGAGWECIGCLSSDGVRSVDSCGGGSVDAAGGPLAPRSGAWERLAGDAEGGRKSAYLRELR